MGNVDANFDISFEELRFSFTMRKWLFTMFSNNTTIKPLHIHIKCLSVNGFDLSMLVLLLPSENKLNGPNAKSSRGNLLRRLLLRLIEVTLESFQCKTSLTGDDVDVVYTCKLMHVSSHDSYDDTETLLTVVTASNPQFSLFIKDKIALHYESNSMIVKLLDNSATNDIELLGNFSSSPSILSTDPSSSSDSNATHSSNKIKIQVQNLLSIYHIYQTSFDEVMQIKINHNFPIDGTIKHIMGELSDSIIELIDDRIATPLQFHLQGGVVDMNTTLPKGKNRKKQVTIKRSSMTLKTVTCLTSKSLMKDIVAVRIVRRLKIPETIIDEEDEEFSVQIKHMNIFASLDTTQFPILDWIFLLQSIPQSLPTSKFKCNSRKVKQQCTVEYYTLSLSSSLRSLHHQDPALNEIDIELLEPQFYIYAINLSGTRSANTSLTVIERNMLPDTTTSNKLSLDYLSDRLSDSPPGTNAITMTVTADDFSYVAGVNTNKLSALYTVDTPNISASTTSNTAREAVTVPTNVKIRYSLTGFSAEFIQPSPSPLPLSSLPLSNYQEKDPPSVDSTITKASRGNTLALQKIVTSMRVMPIKESFPPPLSGNNSTTGNDIDFPFTLDNTTSNSTSDSNPNYITVTRIESNFETGKVSIGMTEVISRVGTADILLIGVTQRIVQWGYKSIKAIQERAITTGPALDLTMKMNTASRFSITPNNYDYYRYKKPTPPPPDYSLLVSSIKINLITSNTLKKKQDGNIQISFEKFAYVKKKNALSYNKAEDAEVRYSWRKLVVLVSDLVIDPQRQLEIMSMERFNFHSYITTPSTNNNSNSSTMKEVVVSCSSIRLFAAAAVPSLSILLQDFQQQCIALANALRTPNESHSRNSSNSNSNSSDTGNDNPQTSQVKRTQQQQQQKMISSIPFKYSFQLTEFEVAIEGLYYYQVSPRFLVAKLSGLQASLQSTDSSAEILEKIHILDGSAGVGVHYGSILGGDVEVKLKDFTITIEPMETAYVVTNDVCIRGLYYNATACNSNIGFNTLKYNLTNALNALSDPMSTTINLSDAPPKHYIDLTLSAAKVDVTIETCTNTCLEMAIATLTACLPSRSEQTGTSPPLMWWDQGRYWIHGSFSMQIDWVVFKKCMVDSHIRVTQVACSAHFFKIEWQSDELEISASEVTVDVEAEYEFNLLGSTNTFSGSSDASSVSSLNSTSQSSVGICPSSINYRCCTIPGFVFSLSVRRRHSEYVHSHHDVYLKKNDTDVDNRDLLMDKYLYFRCARGSSDCTVRLQCADRPDSPITVWARLDIIKRVLDAYSYTNKSKVGDANLSTRHGIRFSRSSEQQLHPTSTATTKKTHTSHVFFPPIKDRSNSIDSNSSSSSDDNDNDGDERNAHTRSTYTSSSDDTRITSLQDLIGRLDLHVHIEQFVASTWSSSSCQHGIVFVQRKLIIKIALLQLEHQSLPSQPPILLTPTSANNNTVKSLPATTSASELYIDHLSAEISNLEIYARDWKMATGKKNSKSTDKKSKRNRKEKGVVGIVSEKFVDHEDSLDDLVKERISKSHTSTLPTTPSEPTSVLQLQSMFAPIHKWGHASKVTVQQKEYSQKQHAHEGKDNNNNNNNKDTDSGTTSSIHEDNDSNTYRPTFSSFLQNHIAFTPPRSALPPSFYYTHSPAFCSQLFRARSNTNSTNSTQAKGKSVRIPKLLSLCITDVKLLWTISIRDSLFIYGIKFYELFMAREEKSGGAGGGSGGGSGNDGGGSDITASVGSGFNFSNINSIKIKRSNSKATMMDFLDVKSVRPRGHRRMHITGHAPVPMPIADPSADSDDITPTTSPQLTLIGSFPSVKYATGGTGSSSVNILSPCPEDGSVSGDTESCHSSLKVSTPSPMTGTDASPQKEKESFEIISDNNSNNTNNNLPSLGYRERMRQSRTNSLRYRSLQDSPLHPKSKPQQGIEERINAFSSTATSNATTVSSMRQRPVSMVVRRTQPDPLFDDITTASAIPRSKTPPGLDKLKSSKRSIDESSATEGWQKQSFDQLSGMPKMLGNGSRDTDKEVEVGDAMEAYFIIEFVNPQLNFLDDKSQGSLVMVAGNATVEGKRSAAAILSCPVPVATTTSNNNNNNNNNNNYKNNQNYNQDTESRTKDNTNSNSSTSTSSSSSLPQRKYEVRLRMDGVSMFTVPTNLEGMEATVHWKPYRCDDDDDFGNEQNETTIGTGVTGSQVFGNIDEEWVRNNRTASVLQDLGRTDLLNKMKKGRDYSESQQDVPFTTSEILQVAVKDFQIRAAYSYFLDVSLEEAAHMVVNRMEEDLVCTFMLDLPAICVDIDSSQFFIMTHVVRDVMLSPPPNLLDHPSRQDPTTTDFNDKERAAALLGKQLKSHTLRGSGTSWNSTRSTKKRFPRSTRQLFSKAVSELQNIDLNTKGGREELKNLVEKHFEEIKHSLGAEMGMDGQGGEEEDSVAGTGNTYRDSGSSANGIGRMTRSVEYCIGRGQWFLKGLDSDQLVEVGFMGLYGSHSFHEDRSSSTLFEVQRFWARNHRPGPESAGFEDESLILSTLHRNDEPCIRCGAFFKPMDNAITSCVFHADNDGQPGEFIHTHKGKGNGTDKDSSKGRGRGGDSYWTCCGQNWEGAQGCSSRPHVCKEMMITIRADAEAALAARGVDLTILQTLEVSVFPGSTNAIRVQITSSLIALLHQYFVIEDGSDEKYRLKQLMGNAPNSSLLQRPRWRSQSTASDHSIPSPVSSASFSPTAISTANSMWSVSAFSPTFNKQQQQQQQQQQCLSPHRVSSRKEGLYVKYLRVGEIGVEVSTAGFPINLDHYKAIVEPFVKHGKVYDWQRLIHKLERHSTWSLTKNTASTSLSRLTGIFFRNTKKAVESSEGVTGEENDDTHRAALLLGGVGFSASSK